MRYLALGDSVSIDLYTGVPGGGAVGQFARLIEAETVQDLTYDGCTTAGVLEALSQVTIAPQIVTVTAGGNDLLLYGAPPAYRAAAVGGDVFSNLAAIADDVARFRCPVILNTIYDPTDGDDALLDALGLPPALRETYRHVNDLIRRLARDHGYLLADLEVLFHGHGMAASAPWLVQQIEPNSAGATAIARCWHALWISA